MLQGRLIVLFLALQPYSQGGMVNYVNFIHVIPNKLMITTHRLQRGIRRYLICFSVLTFVSQRQSKVEKSLHLLVFPCLSADLIPTSSIIRFNLDLILASSRLSFFICKHKCLTVVNLKDQF